MTPSPVDGTHSGNLMGGAGADTFTLTAMLTGSISGEGDGDTFTLNAGSGVSMGIMGGAGDDSFVFAGDVSANPITVSGEIAGGTGADTLDFSSLTSAVMVSLSSRADIDVYTRDLPDMFPALSRWVIPALPPEVSVASTGWLAAWPRPTALPA